MKFISFLSLLFLNSNIALSAVNCTEQWQACSKRCEAFKDPTKCNQGCDKQYDECRRRGGSLEEEDTFANLVESSPWQGSWATLDRAAGKSSMIMFDANANPTLGIVYVPYDHPVFRDKNPGENVRIAPGTKLKQLDQNTIQVETTFPQTVGVFSGDFKWVTAQAPTTIVIKLHPDRQTLIMTTTVTPVRPGGAIDREQTPKSYNSEWTRVRD